MKIELFGRPYNRTDRVQWTLEELGVPYEYRILDVFALEHRSEEYRSLYGLTRLPFVRLDGDFSGYSHTERYFRAQTSRPAYRKIVAQSEYKGNR